MKLVDTINTYNPCLNALTSLGFEVTLIPTDDDDSIGDWRATRDDVMLAAEDPVRLLGLTCLVLCRGKQWRRDGDVDKYQELIDAAYPDEQ